MLYAAIAAYISVNLGAFFTAVELGIQPLLFHTADGRALFFPYNLAQSVYFISGSHLIIGGVVEAAVTAMAVRYMQRANQPLLAVYPHGSPLPGGAPAPAKVSLKKVYAAIIGLVILAPLGLLATGTAWGEWSPEEIRKMIGYVPEGIAKASGSSLSLMPDYAIKGLDKNLFQSSAGYIISAVAGLALIFLAVYLFNKFQAKGEKSNGL